jgi:hypothetical protein
MPVRLFGSGRTLILDIVGPSAVMDCSEPCGAESARGRPTTFPACIYAEAVVLHRLMPVVSAFRTALILR